MSPRHRTDWPTMFAELREWLDAIPEAHKTEHDAVCDGCGSRLFLVRGRHSGKFFWSHEGVHGCEIARPIFFTDKLTAVAAEVIFK